MIKISNLNKNYGDKAIIKDLNLEIKKAEIFGLVGINGAGKSTLLRILAGVIKQDSGSILINDAENFDNILAKRDLFFLPDDPYYTSNTTANTLIKLYETVYNFDSKQFEHLMKKFNLDSNTPIHTFSKGMRRQIYMSLAIASKPKILLLDEAFDGLDPKARLLVKRALIDMVSENNTIIIISSHSLRELEDICDSFGVLEDGYFKTSGLLLDELNKLNKYQIAFMDLVSEEMFKELKPLNIQITGRVARIVIKGERSIIESKLRELNPILLETIPVNFEELFIYEVDKKVKNND